MGEINQLLTRLAASRRMRGAWLLPLHSAVSPAEQRAAFKVPPPGAPRPTCCF